MRSLVSRLRDSDQSSPALTSAGGVARQLNAASMRPSRSYPANAMTRRSTDRNPCDGPLLPNQPRGRSLALSLFLFIAVSCTGEKDDTVVAARPKPATAAAQPEGPASAELMRGFRPDKKWAHRPRPRAQENEGLRALPDGELKEWERDSVSWLKANQAIPGASGWSGPSDLSARLAFASYSSGISMALVVVDDHGRAAKYAGALDSSDHVELELIPRGERALSKIARKVVGLSLRLGTVRQLIEIKKVPGIERKVKPTCTAVPTGNGYRLEAKIPLTALTPLPGPELKKLDYRVTLFDADAAGEKAAPTLRFSGQFRPNPAPRVPEAVRKRGSVRACMATEKDALWGYWNGWRCAMPFERPLTQEEDGADLHSFGLAFHRVPHPPRLVWIREQLLFINLPGINRGVAALINEGKVITSLMRLGVVSAEDPGNPLSRDSGVEHFKLPDGTWAVAVTHAYPRDPGPLGGQCGGTHRVYLSVLALQRAFTSTPHKPAPVADPPPELEEIFRVVLEDCRTRVADDWSLSKDRRSIQIKSSLHPDRPPREYVFERGKYVIKK